MGCGMFEQLFYLIGLIIVIGCLALTDMRFKLVFFRDMQRAFKTTGASYVIFLLWDIAGIRSEIFFIGPSRFMTHINVIRNFMLEEIFFLVILVYLPLVLWEGFKTVENKAKSVL